MDAPDKYTGAWYKAQFEGLCHTLNLYGSQQQELQRKCGVYEKRITSLEESVTERDAKIGELQEKLTDMKSKHEKLVEHLKTRFEQLNGKTDRPKHPTT